jgi:hypothetical protein
MERPVTAASHGNTQLRTCSLLKAWQKWVVDVRHWHSVLSFRQQEFYLATEHSPKQIVKAFWNSSDHEVRPCSNLQELYCCPLAAQSACDFCGA